MPSACSQKIGDDVYILTKSNLPMDDAIEKSMLAWLEYRVPAMTGSPMSSLPPLFPKPNGRQIPSSFLEFSKVAEQLF